MKLSVLDQSPVSAGSTPAQALQNTIDLARRVDDLGYHRYWIAEHHGMETLASTAPEVLLARVGAETSRIKIGSGAILLPHYSAFKVAEVFRTLSALYPGRVDLGIGRAPGGTQREARALSTTRGTPPINDNFLEQLHELLAFLGAGFPSNHPFANVRVSPEASVAPEPWLLGSSLWSAETAARMGLPYAFAHFINPESTRMAIEHYRENFQASAYSSRPYVIVALGVTCAETEREAQRLSLSSRALFRRLRTIPRDPGLVPAPDDAALELSTGLDPSIFESGEWPRYAVGNPQQVLARLEEITSELSADELMVVTIVHNHEARVQSYELLADACRVATGPAVATAALR